MSSPSSSLAPTLLRFFFGLWLTFDVTFAFFSEIPFLTALDFPDSFAFEFFTEMKSKCTSLVRLYVGSLALGLFVTHCSRFGIGIRSVKVTPWPTLTAWLTSSPEMFSELMTALAWSFCTAACIFWSPAVTAAALVTWWASSTSEDGGASLQFVCIEDSCSFADALSITSWVWSFWPTAD